MIHSEINPVRKVTVDSAKRGLEESDIAELLRASDSYSTTTADLSELTEYMLEKHHLLTGQELGRLPQLMRKVVGRHGTKHPELYKLQKLLTQLAKDVISHMLKEERVLFPYVIELESHIKRETPLTQPHFGTVNNPIRMMRLEHEDAGEILVKMNSISRGYAVPAGACSSFRSLYTRLAALEKDLHEHIHLENNILFPAAIDLEKKMFLDMLGLS